MTVATKSKIVICYTLLQFNDFFTESFTPLKGFSSRNALTPPKIGLIRKVPLLVKTSDQEEPHAMNEPGGATTTENDLSMFFATTTTNEVGEHSTEPQKLLGKATSPFENESDSYIESDKTKLPRADEIANFISKPQNELIDAGLVLLSSFIVALETLPSSTLPQFTPSILYHAESFLSYFFCIGFFLRWYAVGNLSMKYFTKPLPILDFFASVMPLILMKGVPLFGIAVPAWVALDNSALVNLRLLRILRLQELLVDEETFSKVEVTLGIQPGDVRPYQLQLARVLISIFTLCSVATGLIYTAEHDVNPMIPDYFTALYFGLTTLTTVGFGDITPITLPGRLVVMGSILVGVAVIPAQAAELVEALLDFQSERRQKSMMKNTLRSRMEGEFQEDQMIDPRISCSSCGRRSHRADASFCWSCGTKLWQ
jgi:voltage-gated potassium channel